MNKNTAIIVFIGVLLGTGIAVALKISGQHKPQDLAQPLAQTIGSAQQSPNPTPIPVPVASPNPSPSPAPQLQNAKPFLAPVDRAKERPLKKPFGIFVTPQNSPTQPERFSGYHTGFDFEIFPEELNLSVSVRAICDGKLLFKGRASGYGGYAVESCILNNSPVTIIYGHLKLASISLTSASQLKAGDQIGILGAAFSAETDGERKHLHLGIHKGRQINIRGYVQAKSELSQWIDSATVIQ